jgi:hypothetical protein
MAGGDAASLTRTAARRFELGALVPGLTTFTAVAWIGIANGGYFATEWGWAALAFVLLALLALLGRERVTVSRLEWAAVLALGGFASWTLLSVVWSPSAAQPVLAFERTSVYMLALLAVLLVSTSKTSAVGLVSGVLAGTVVVCADGVLAYSGSGRLAAPIGYANGIGILAAIGLLVALGLAANTVERHVRALAFGAVPLLVATLHLTYSRGSWAALGVGIGVAVLVDVRRLHLLAMLALALPASALLVALAPARPGSQLVVPVLTCSAVAVAIGWMLPRFEQRVRIGGRGRRVAAVTFAASAVVALLAFAAAAGGPGRLAARLHQSFARPLPASGGDLDRRVLSASTDGRIDYWRVAWHEVEDRPLLGGGAGSYARYWQLLSPSGLGVRNAHNLYLETLAELGPVGLVLLLAAFAVPFVAARRVRDQPATTAGTAAFAAFAAHAAVDWDFQLVAVSLAALFCAASVLVSARREAPFAALGTVRRWSGAAALATIGVLAIVAQVGNSALAQSRAALDRDEPGAAADLARRAERWQPWSFEPAQALGEAQLAAGRLAQSRSSLRHALERDRVDASVWLDLAAASTGTARLHALAQARNLDPKLTLG